MYQGSMPAEVRSILAEWASGVAAEAFYVPYSGAFNVERVLASVKPVHSCDPSLYSAALGTAFAGRSLKLELRGEYHERLSWLEPYLADPLQAAATVQLCTKMLVGVDGHNAYNERIRAGYRQQWAALTAKAVAKWEAKPLRLASFSAADPLVWLAQVPDDAAVAAFPPPLVDGPKRLGGASFTDLGRVFCWEGPDVEFDRHRLDRLVAAVTARPDWFLGLDVERPDLAAYQRGRFRRTNLSKPLYLYSSAGAVRHVGPHQRFEPVMVPRPGPGDRLTGPLEIRPLSTGQFAAIRSQYLNAHIAPGQAKVRLAVISNGLLIGVVALGPVTVPAQWVKYLPPTTGFLLSDFAVDGSDYKHLAKLVVAAALSAEVKAYYERCENARIRSLATTVFSKNPKSMKYRTMMKLLKRESTDNPAQPYRLLYGTAEWGTWTLAEAFADWQAKFGQLREDNL